jgi:hypothetical protein
MHNVSTPLAVSIEVTSLANLEGNDGWIDFAEKTGKEMGGRPHWGQQNKMSVNDLITLYNFDDINAWKEQCRRMVGPFSTTFSNNYTRQRGLEPDAIIRIVTHTIKENGTVTHFCNPGEWWSPIPIGEAIRHTETQLCRYQTKLADEDVPGALLRLRRILTTPVGGGREDNLDYLPRCEVTSLAPPPADQFRLRITSVIQIDSPWTVIQFVCNDDEGWGLHVLDAQRQIEAGMREFYVVDPRTGGEKTALIREYLTTDVGGVAANNLDNLPEC